MKIKSHYLLVVVWIDGDVMMNDCIQSKLAVSVNAISLQHQTVTFTTSNPSLDFSLTLFQQNQLLTMQNCLKSWSAKPHTRHTIRLKTKSVYAVTKKTSAELKTQTVTGGVLTAQP